MSEAADPGGIAIIGMGLRVPGAADLAAYWRNLRDGVSSIATFSDDELLAAGVDAELLRDPGYVRARGVPADTDRFDAALFALTPREAETMDPQHRLFLELAWETFDHAGYDPVSYDGAVGVYAGSNISSYLIHNLVPHRELVRRIGPLQLRIRNDKDFLATLASYKLNLRGPSVNVQTACSTSLVAVCLAGQSLLGYQCDMALAGGVSVTSPARSGYLHQEGVYAPDGCCRAFDEAARGTVLGDGCAVVLLKRLEDARRDGDTVHAVIRGFATNNDGSLKLDYSAPSIDGQAEVIATALAVGDVDPATVGYIEAHGTGTPLGDVIEIAALTQAFAAGTGRRGRCAIGSVKTNIGHLDAAAGTASLIKAVLTLAHRQIPPSLGYERPNPRIDFARTPFVVNARLADWPASATPRRAGVSSFGVGGTNAHVVLEEPPPPPPPAPARPWLPLVLSARTPAALERAAVRLADHLAEHTDLDLADVCHTLQRGRRAFAARRMLVCRTAAPAEAVALLRGAEPRRVLASEVDTDQPPAPAFLFSGIGDHYVGMARGLYEGEPLFREQVDLCCAQLAPHLRLDLAALLYPPGVVSAPVERTALDLRCLLGRAAATAQGPAASPLDATAVLHPAMFVVEYALARLWMSWGIQPQAMIGYSIGEYVAACLAGVFSLPAALTLVATRARLVAALPRGAMLAVALPEAELTRRLAAADGALSLAAVNTPTFCVCAGPEEAVAALAAALAAEGVVCRRLRAEHAFHSPMMEEAADACGAAAARLTLAPPAIPFVSNVTGTWITAEQATDPRYWGEHLCRTVRFGAGLATLCAAGGQVLLEIGPGNTLASIALQSSRPPIAIASLPHAHDGEPEAAVMAAALGRLWLAGVAPDWGAYWAEQPRRRVPLPAYPFERTRFWIDPPRPGEGGAGRPAAAEENLAKRQDPADWFYLPVWRELPLLASPGTATADAANASDAADVANAADAADTAKASHTAASAAGVHATDLAPRRPWLIFDDGLGLGRCLAGQLRAAGCAAVTVARAGRCAEAAPGRWTLDPSRREHYRELLQALHAQDLLPGTVCHLWSLAPLPLPPLPPPPGPPEPPVGEAPTATPAGAPPASADGLRPELGILSLIFLAQAWGERAGGAPLRLVAVSGGAHEVTGDETLDPLQATLTGPCRVIPQEYPHISCLHVDLPGRPAADPWPPAVLELWAARLLAEGRRDGDEPAVAWRGRSRWVEAVQPVRLEAPAAGGWRLREGGVYLITGGLGGIGLTLAAVLAERVRARLVLVGRGAPSAAAAARLRSLTARGVQVLVLAADVTQRAAMEEVRQQALARFGAVHGVIHAAGVPPGGLIQVKEPDALAAVLAPKLAGTRVVHEVFGAAGLDFLVLCSSLTAQLGGLGLVDHCAANAFLDAFARQAARQGAPVLAVAWDSWLEVGQAARAGTATRLRALLGGTAAAPLHPLLDERADEPSGGQRFLTRLDAGERWVVREHRIGGLGIVPATAFLEMARAAHALATDALDGAATAPAAGTAVSAAAARDVLLRDVVFAQPLAVADGASCEVSTTLRPAGAGMRFEIASRAPGAAHWTAHVHGAIELVDRGLAPLAEAAPAGVDRTAELVASLDAGAVELGPHWRRLQRELRGAGRRGWARFAMPEEFHHELAAFGLHPALLDSATGVARILGVGVYLPAACRRIRLRAPLPAAVQSRFELRDAVGEEADAAAPGDLLCDITISDDAGRPLVEMEGYRLRRVAEPGTTASQPRPPGVPSPAADEAFGLTPAEGAEVFLRVLSRRLAESRVLVSVRDLAALRRRFRRLGREPLDDHLARLRATGEVHPRPRLRTAYQAPRSPLEEQLARLFQEMLGIDRAGIHDNFFDLGGNSLVATQLLSRLRDELAVEVPLRTLFEAPTIGELVPALVLLQAESADGEALSQALAELRQMSREQLRARLRDEGGGQPPPGGEEAS